MKKLLGCMIIPSLLLHAHNLYAQSQVNTINIAKRYCSTPYSNDYIKAGTPNPFNDMVDNLVLSYTTIDNNKFVPVLKYCYKDFKSVYWAEWHSTINPDGSGSAGVCFLYPFVGPVPTGSDDTITYDERPGKTPSVAPFEVSIPNNDKQTFTFTTSKSDVAPNNNQIDGTYDLQSQTVTLSTSPGVSFKRCNENYATNLDPATLGNNLGFVHYFCGVITDDSSYLNHKYYYQIIYLNPKDNTLTCSTAMSLQAPGAASAPDLQGCVGWEKSRPVTINFPEKIALKTIPPKSNSTEPVNSLDITYDLTNLESPSFTINKFTSARLPIVDYPAALIQTTNNLLKNFNENNCTITPTQ